jgi:predicted small metal-binding protein
MTTYELNMADLGVANDSTVISGDSPGELVEKVVDHLRSEHNIDMPDADVIMGDFTGAPGLLGVPAAGFTSGQAAVAPIGAGGDRGDDAQLIVQRLRELLNLRTD